MNPLVLWIAAGVLSILLSLLILNRVVRTIKTGESFHFPFLDWARGIGRGPTEKQTKDWQKTDTVRASGPPKTRKGAGEEPPAEFELTPIQRGVRRFITEYVFRREVSLKTSKNAELEFLRMIEFLESRHLILVDERDLARMRTKDIVFPSRIKDEDETEM